MNRNTRDRALMLLTHYLRSAYVAAGIRWTADNEAEVQEIVDALIAARTL